MKIWANHETFRTEYHSSLHITRVGNVVIQTVVGSVTTVVIGGVGQQKQKFDLWESILKRFFKFKLVLVYQTTEIYVVKRTYSMYSAPQRQERNCLFFQEL